MTFNETIEIDSYQKNKNTVESILALKPDARSAPTISESGLLESGSHA